MAFARKFTDQLQAFANWPDRLATQHDADAMLFLMERPTDWARLRQATGSHTVLLAGDTEETLEGAGDEDFETILLNMPSEAPVYERLTQSLLEAVAEELLPAGASVVAVYSGFEPTVIDSLSIIRLGEHLGQLTVRDLRQLKTAFRSIRSKRSSTWPSTSAAKAAKETSRLAIRRRRPSQSAQLLSTNGFRSTPRL